MKAKEKANELVNKYKLILINEDTECGNEILCTILAIKNAHILVDEIIKSNIDISETYFWLEVKKEIDKIKK